MRLVRENERENERENGCSVFTVRENARPSSSFCAHRAARCRSVCVCAGSIQARFSPFVKTNGPFSRKNRGVFTSKTVQVSDVIESRENVKIKGGF